MKKRHALLVLIPLAFAACKKNNDVAPDPAATVSGTYTLTSFLYRESSDSINLPTLPYTAQGGTISGTVAVVKNKTPNFINMTLTLKATGQTDSTLPLDSVEVRSNGSTYGLYYGTTSLGTADGNNLNINVTEVDPQTKDVLKLAFTAKK